MTSGGEPADHDNLHDSVSSSILEDARQTKTASLDQIRDAIAAPRILGLVANTDTGGTFVDIGLAQPVRVFLSFRDPTPEKGSPIELAVVGYDAQLDEPLLSRETARLAAVWRRLMAARDSGKTISAVVAQRRFNGWMLDFEGVGINLPKAHAADPETEELTIGEAIAVRLLNVSPWRGALASRRAVLNVHARRATEAFLDQLTPGQVWSGTVESIVDYGVFVRIGDRVTGLLHSSRISRRKRDADPYLYEPGDELEVVIENVDRERDRVALTRLPIEPDPWLKLDRKLVVGAELSGQISNIVGFGIFVEIAPGIEGLAHYSSLSQPLSINEAQYHYEIGDNIDVRILNIDKTRRRISLEEISIDGELTEY